MPRVKRGTTSLKRRRKILKATKGFRWGRKSKERLAKEAILHSWSNMFVGRKQKKRNFRRLWQTKISAGTKREGMSYSYFINVLKKNNIGLDRKSLADLAEHQPEIFKKIVERVK
ncbi:MAG: 50S ribosomal protein L20 [Candidatus Harrisonbacteria bacterium CG10_big_fil_rev_8_21_14_0_10_44_23]|uniref:Large ribosomal subunit protein bL20 n=1 Tax=Candidatus Harrisonbacteria bacterium CG10_big_fil_rev_8_21_14_0_10_44_23 TaxID=1974585 RepID=A0A2H0UQB4_9BACT|nr:MAG: 50S ribosomal protein L20 [Candidatus Harrisonbacteria bacterium CG10_big_fil_rev_8_21_14_0_10_44_23]